jgi:hypothetical protein
LLCRKSNVSLGKQLKRSCTATAAQWLPIELHSTKTQGALVASSIGKASMSARSPMTLPLVWFTSAHMVPKSRLMRAITISPARTKRDIVKAGMSNILGTECGSLAAYKGVARPRMPGAAAMRQASKRSSAKVLIQFSKCFFQGVIRKKKKCPLLTL